MDHSLSRMKQLVKPRRRQEEDDQDLAIIAISLGGGPTHIQTLQTYLTQSDLAGHPQFSSAWAHIRSLDAAGGLGLLLHWLSSTMAGHSLHQIFAITPAVCAQCLQHARSILLTVLKDLQIARIIPPPHKLFWLNLPVMVADDKETQNADYNGWTCSHYCSNLLTFAPDGIIIHVILNAPGSWHNSNIASHLYHQLLHNTPEGYRVISDTAFPQVTKRLDYRIVAPSKCGDQLPTNPVDFAQLKLFNNKLVSARQAAEWGMQSIQGSFSRLKLPLPAADHEYREEVIELAVRLHQVKCQSVGINQTQTVYQSTVESENHILARTFHRMLL
ncbi:hypothetical protein MJO28_017506 [Puccinia striiformis f. sp. tritici]|nr:hypothetical protein MJO28_017506 [Puccinia striiformis f. sp. tritici]